MSAGVKNENSVVPPAGAGSVEQSSDRCNCCEIVTHWAEGRSSESIACFQSSASYCLERKGAG
jgi:hypothetical protein